MTSTSYPSVCKNFLPADSQGSEGSGKMRHPRGERCSFHNLMLFQIEFFYRCHGRPVMLTPRPVGHPPGRQSSKSGPSSVLTESRAAITTTD